MGQIPRSTERISSFSIEYFHDTCVKNIVSSCNEILNNSLTFGKVMNVLIYGSLHSLVISSRLKNRQVAVIRYGEWL